MRNIKWIFFDIGSTLVDETECYKLRINQTIEHTNTISYKEFEEKMRNYAIKNKDAYKETIKELNLHKAEWPLHKEKLYGGVKELLEELHKEFKLGIIANQKSGLNKRMYNFGILNFFDVIICSAEVGVSKPNKEIFYLGLKKANCKPKEAIMVGDRIDNDLIPAKEIGMKTIWVKQGYGGMAKVENLTEIVDIEINNICDLSKIINKK